MKSLLLVASFLRFAAFTNAGPGGRDSFVAVNKQKDEKDCNLYNNHDGRAGDSFTAGGAGQYEDAGGVLGFGCLPGLRQDA